MFKDVSMVMCGPYPNLRKRFLTLFCLWFINTASYYGLTLNTKNLGGDYMINFLINAMVEIPAITLVILVGKAFKNFALSLIVVIQCRYGFRTGIAEVLL